MAGTSFGPGSTAGFTSWNAGYGPANTFATFGQGATGGGGSFPTITPVTPNFDPKIEANALYGKPMTLAAMGFARIGSAPAPIVGPYINAGKVDFIVSFGVAVPLSGDRKIYAIYLDNELAWSSVAGGTLPAHGTFAAESFDFIFKPGTLTQTVCSLETEKFPGDENAYRPQMLLQIRNLTYQRFMDKTGKPVPYVSCDIGDVTSGADPDDGLNLGTALERIAHSPFVGYDSTSFESVDVTDVVPAILLRENITIDELCQAEARVYRNLVYRLSDKRYVINKGAAVAPDIVIDRDDIISNEDESVIITRAEVGRQARELELFTVDPDQDYTVVSSLAKRPRDPVAVSASVGKDSVTLPNVMDASTRQAIVTYMLYADEVARKKVAFTIKARGLEVEPGDNVGLLNIADGIDNEVYRITETSDGANFTKECFGEAIMRCSLFELPAIDHQGCFNREVTASNTTFEDVSFGETNVARYIIVGVNLRMAATGQTISAMTIGGVSATAVATASHSAEGLISAVYYALVPSGVSGDVEITTSGNFQQLSIHVYRAVAPSFAVHDFDDNEATTASAVAATLDVPANGIAIAAAATRLGASFTWSGATESCTFVNDVDTTGQRSSALRIAAGAESGTSISVDPSSIDRVTIAAASFVLA